MGTTCGTDIGDSGENALAAPLLMGEAGELTCRALSLVMMPRALAVEAAAAPGGVPTRAWGLPRLTDGGDRATPGKNTWPEPEAAVGLREGKAAVADTTALAGLLEGPVDRMIALSFNAASSRDVVSVKLSPNPPSCRILCSVSVANQAMLSMS